MPATEPGALGAHDDESDLPSTFRQALRTELRRTFRAPYEIPVVVAVNGALMSSAWFFLPPPLKDDVFSLHGSLVFAGVLASWMYSDVPATNVHGLAPALHPPGG